MTLPPVLPTGSIVYLVTVTGPPPVTTEPAEAAGDPVGDADGEAAPVGLAVAGVATGVVAPAVAVVPLGVELELVAVAAPDEALLLDDELLLLPQAASKPATIGAPAPKANA